MARTTAFARVTPRRMLCEETFHYVGEMSRNVYIDLDQVEAPNQNPSGLLTIELPYDGSRWFDATAQNDIHTAAQLGLDTGEAIVGYLAFSHVGHTDLASRLSLSPSTHAWPLLLPLRDEDQDLAQLIARDAVCSIRQPYQINPAALEIIPIRVSIDITDETGISASSGKRAANRSGFESDLILEFKLQLVLPRDLPQPEAVIENASISWPWVSVPDLFRLETGSDQDSAASNSLAFDPATRRVNWNEGQKASAQRLLKEEQDSKSISGYRTFKSQVLRLCTLRPSDLYAADRLDVSFDLLLKNVLLSGLAIQPFHATGKPAIWQVERNTRLHVNLALWPADRFREKTYTPRRYLVFGGVVANRKRVEDLKALLVDLGFTSIKEGGTPGQSTGSDTLSELILEAERTERSRQMKIWVILRGETAQTRVSTHIRGGRSYQTDQTTGRSALEIIVQQAADHVKLTETLNELQFALKERFRHVTVIN